jgi:hypothetical protein
MMMCEKIDTVLVNWTIKKNIVKKYEVKYKKINKKCINIYFDDQKESKKKNRKEINTHIKMDIFKE